MTLPQHIIIATEKNKTSLGDNPCLPPEEENKFLTELLLNYFETLSNKFKDVDETSLRNELSKLVTTAKKLEESNITNLEKLCINTTIDLFQIPEDCIKLDCKIVDSVDTSNERLIPQKTENFSFEDIEEMQYLTDEIYKRRVINSLIIGASLYYSTFYDIYFNKIFELVPELPLIYKKIMTINNFLLYLTKDSLKTSRTNDVGKVDVYAPSINDFVKIKSEGIIFPILFYETIKGMLELSASHGLPKDREKALYILNKADFKLAEMWDSRIGLPLWKNIVDMIKKLDYDEISIGINFIIMHLASLKPNVFNKVMKEIFAKTNKGKEVLKNILEEIIYNKEKDKFDNFIQTKNSETPILNDNEEDFFKPEELILDSEY